MEKRYVLKLNTPTITDLVRGYMVKLKSNLYFTDITDVMKTAKFLHTELGISHRQMALQGHLLTKSHLKMKFRYDFMVFMNRVNFDPSKPNYHTYDILWEGTLEEFCKKLHTTEEALDLFAKSL